MADVAEKKKKPKTGRFKNSGFRPAGMKLTAGSSIEKAHMPKLVRIPLGQHQGAPAKLLVKAGDRVTEGQLIGEADGVFSSNVHASVSGQVTAIEKGPCLGNQDETFVVIRTGGVIRNWQEKKRDPASMNPEQMASELRKAGVIGMSGSAYPTHLKFDSSGKKTDVLLINGAECEPYLTADHRIMAEKTDDIIVGVRCLMKIFGAKKAVIGIGENKTDAYWNFQDRLQGDPDIRVVLLAENYPQGGEKQLVQAMTGIEIPSGALPNDAGVSVINVSTVFAVYEALVCQKPLIERVITYTGEQVRNRGNIKVRVGTTFRELFEEFGVPEKHGAIIAGGPLTGVEVTDLDTPVTKALTGIIVLPPAKDYRVKNGPCIRCGICLRVCPVRLQPTELAKLCDLGLMEEAVKDRGLLDCIECGACSFVCPSVIPITALIRYGKENWKNR